MIVTNNNIKEILSKLKKDDYIYLSIMMFFFIILIIIFSMTVSFFSKNINKVFYSENNQKITGLDIAQYTLVAKKLNLTTPTTPTMGTTTSIVTSATTIAQLDKKSLLIKILNGTTKKSLASTLAKSITDDGFIVSKTGNEKSDYGTTTIIVQENKSEYTPTLLESVRKIYPTAVATTTDKISAFEATIIIGNK